MSNYQFLISESLSDTVIVYLILKRLTKPYDEWDAFKLGIIDKDGKKLKNATSAKEKAAWTSLDVMVWNMKRLLGKYVNRSVIARYFTAAMLLADSIRPYMNHKLLKEGITYPELSDMTCERQSVMYRVLRNVVIEKVDLSDEDRVICEIMMKEKTVEALLNQIDESAFLSEITGGLNG